MNFGPLIFLAAFFALGASWFGLVFKPVNELGSLNQTNTVPSGPIYPQARSGLAQRGAEVYRANGCAYCHSQNVQQSGTVWDLYLTEAGTNQAALAKTVATLNPRVTSSEFKDWVTKLPQALLEGLSPSDADAAAAALKKTGAKSERRVRAIGPDIARGWGWRGSVARDYLYDSPALVGVQRVGPDLANVGARLSDANWHLRHLYAPASVMQGSKMPPYKFLFDTRKIRTSPSPDALMLAGGFAPPADYEVVATEEANALVGYLLSLRSEAPLAESPVTIPVPPEPSTNAPAGTSSK